MNVGLNGGRMKHVRLIAGNGLILSIALSGACVLSCAAAGAEDSGMRDDFGGLLDPPGTGDHGVNERIFQASNGEDGGPDGGSAPAMPPLLIGQGSGLGNESSLDLPTIELDGARLSDSRSTRLDPNQGGLLVPAPGALVLLGMPLLAGRRRRRSS